MLPHDAQIAEQESSKPDKINFDWLTIENEFLTISRPCMVRNSHADLPGLGGGRAPIQAGLKAPIHIAAELGHTDTIHLLLDNDVWIDSIDSLGRTALHMAALCGHVDVLRSLLLRGASMTSTDHKGWTPLHYATKHGRMECLQLLLESGSDGSLLVNDCE